MHLFIFIAMLVSGIVSGIAGWSLTNGSSHSDELGDGLLFISAILIGGALSLPAFVDLF